MDEKIKLNNDKTIRYIDCKECRHHISFVEPITIEELKLVSFDCTNCTQTYFLDGDNIITAEQRNEKVIASVKEAFNNTFRRRKG